MYCLRDDGRCGALPHAPLETFLKKGFKTSKNFWKIFWLNLLRFGSVRAERYAMWGPLPHMKAKSYIREDKKYFLF
jgi:hypothetical protein